MNGSKGLTLFGTIIVTGFLLVVLMLVMGGSFTDDVEAVEQRPPRSVAAPAGRTYNDLLLDEARSVIYAAGMDDNANDLLDVVDLDTLAIVDTVSLPLSPLQLALSADGSELAVAGDFPAGIAFVDLDSREVSPILSLPQAPYSLVYGRPGRLFAGLQLAGEPPVIGVFDTISVTNVISVTLPGIQSGTPQLAITGDGADLYVLPAFSTNPIVKLNALSDTLPLLAQTPHPVGASVLAVTDDGSRVFTDNAIWDGNLGDILATFSLPDYAPADHIVYEPTLEQVYFQTPMDTRVFDAFTGQQVETYEEVFDFAGFVISPSRRRLYYVAQQGGFKSLPWRYYYAYLPNVLSPYELIYAEEFADPISGWYVEDTPEIRLSYQEGEYELRVREPEWWAGVVDPVDLDAASYRLDVDVRQARETNALYGIIFDWRDWNNFKLLAIVPGEELVGLYGIDSGSLVTFQDLASHAVAGVGTAWHHVRIEEASSRCVAWIDGVEVIDVVCPPASSTFRAGFYLEAADQVPAVLRVDNVTVRSLPWDYTPSRPAVPLLAPTAAGGGEPWLVPLLRIDRK
jgi:hypothetical protein